MAGLPPHEPRVDTFVLSKLSSLEQGESMRFLSTAGEPKVLSSDELEDVVERLRRVCAEKDVVLLYLHGSHARGEQGPVSDLDLAVLVDRGRTSTLELELDMLGAFQAASGREDVDVVFLDRAGSIIKDRVVRSGRLIFARSERERIRFEEKAVKEYLDFRYFSKQYDAALFETLAEGRLFGRS